MGSYDQMLRVLNHLTWKTFAEFMHLSTVRGPCCAAVFKVFFFFIPSYAAKTSDGRYFVPISPSLIKLQEVDEPLLLDMSDLCLSDDFIHNNHGKLQIRFLKSYTAIHFYACGLLFHHLLNSHSVLNKRVAQLINKKFVH